LNILGLNINHSNSSVVLYTENKIAFAAEEERYSFIKHSGAFPNNAIKKALSLNNLKLDDIDYITLNSDPYSNLQKKISYFIKNLNFKKFFLAKDNFIKNKSDLISNLQKLDFGIFKGKIERFEHHLCHLASASFYSSHDKSLSISIDGSGDFVTSCVAISRENKLNVIHKNYFPHSLGIFYQALTQFIGFRNFGEEYKLMGLSAYGVNEFKKKMDELINFNDGKIELNLSFFRFQNIKTFEILQDGKINLNQLYNSNLEKFFGEIEIKDKQNVSQIQKNFAFSLQNKYEDIFFKYLNFYQKKLNIESLDLSGGCAMNSLANGKIKEKTNFQNIYIQPAAYDAGCPLGSVALQLNKFNKKRFILSNYLGDSFNNNECEKIIKNKKLFNNKNFEVNFIDNDNFYDYLSELIINNKIVGFFQGKLEWGARALGNRSIICDSRNKDMKDILNKKIKRRESFRPFAPIIMSEKVSEWFETSDDIDSMMQVHKVKKEKRGLIPSVVHNDGTGRLQTVKKKENEKIYRLLESFFIKTGVPILINTSFNENEPIVSNPEQAIDTFLRTDMDCIVLENWIIKKID